MYCKIFLCCCLCHIHVFIWLWFLQIPVNEFELGIYTHLYAKQPVYMIYIHNLFTTTCHFQICIKIPFTFFLICFRYNYNREDEEIYKEFLEIANDLIPSMMKHVAGENAARIHHTSLLYNPESYANFLRFYDGICEWEEDSPTPVLHITWAKQLVFSISKFDISVRIGVDLKGENGDGDESEDSEDDENSSGETKDKNQNVKEESSRNKTDVEDGEQNTTKARGRVGRQKKRSVSTKTSAVNGNSEEEKIKSAIEELESKVGGEESEKEDINPNIPDLAKACSESILNPEFLLGAGEPFTTATTTTSVTTSNAEASLDEFLSSKSNGSPFMGMTVDSMLKAESPSDMVNFRKRPPSTFSHTPSPLLDNREGQSETIIPSPTPNEPGPPVILCLHSQKMKGLKKIFASSKLNASAIKLQLTAQSQVHFKHSKRSTDSDFSTHRKRSRRE